VLGHSQFGLSKHRTFSIYRNIPEILVGKLMEHDLLGRSGGEFPGETEFLKKGTVFRVGMLQKEISLPFIRVSSIIPVLGF